MSIFGDTGQRESVTELWHAVEHFTDRFEAIEHFVRHTKWARAD